MEVSAALPSSVLWHITSPAGAFRGHFKVNIYNTIQITLSLSKTSNDDNLDESSSFACRVACGHFDTGKVKKHLNKQ